MKMRKVGAIILCSMIFLSSCATLAERERPYFHFQGMAEKGTVVATVDLGSETELLASAFGGMEEITDRAKRVSVAINAQSDAYPLEPDNLDLSGVIEGDFSSFIINTALMYIRDFSRSEGEDGRSWFSQKQGPLSLHSPKNNTLVFTNGEYEKAYASYKDKRRLISDDIAQRMANASFALYSFEPETFFDLGLDLPQSVFQQAREVLLLVHRSGEEYTINAYITMRTEKLATTLSQMVRSGYVKRLRTERISFKIADLKLMFLLDDNLVTIEQMPLSEEQIQLLKQSLNRVL